MISSRNFSSRDGRPKDFSPKSFSPRIFRPRIFRPRILRKGRRARKPSSGIGKPIVNRAAARAATDGYRKTSIFQRNPSVEAHRGGPANNILTKMPQI
jgi:hypothetical protein